MVSDQLRKSREVLAYGLLAVAVLYLTGAVLALLLTSSHGVGPEFSQRSAAFGFLFAAPVLVFSLLAAVALASGMAEVQSGKRVALIAVVLAGLAFIASVVTLVATLGASDRPSVPLGGVVGASRYVALLLGLGNLLALGLTGWFAVTVFRSVGMQASRLRGSASTAPGELSGPAGEEVLSARAPLDPVRLPEPWAGAGGASAESPHSATWGDALQGQPASLWGSEDPGASSVDPADLGDSGPVQEPSRPAPQTGPAHLSGTSRGQRRSDAEPGAGATSEDAGEPRPDRKWWEIPPAQ